MHLRYRPDIDGLRAIAVISVIFYHAEKSFGNFKILPGGFIGVDVFFVVSGFLITSIILKELKETGSFSFKNFYIRRVKRIIPVLLLVFTVTFSFAWLYFIPTSFLDFSNSLLSSLSFLSNYYFYSSGELYDAENSLLKPLLHTWSLSIEEQFYLFFPLVLITIFKLFKKILFEILFFLTSLSFLIMLFIFQTNESLAFFSFFSRIWELLFGGVTAILYLNKKKENNFLYNFFPFLGLLIILYSVLFYNESTRSPYFSTLLPVLGTSLIIYFNDKDKYIYKFLALKSLVFIGLISYSLYLWHYPVFAIGRVTEFFGDGVSKKLFLITFLLSLLSYYIVENPIRKSNKKNSQILVGISLFYIILLGLVLASTNGNIKSVRGDFLKDILIGNGTSNLTVCKGEKVNKFGYCIFNPNEKKTLILVGDSHMQTLEKPLLEFSNNNKIKLIILNKTTCFYFLNLNLFVKNKLTSCTSEYQEMRRKIILSQPNVTVIIGGRTQHYLLGNNFNNLEGGGNDKKNQIFYSLNNQILIEDNVELIKNSLYKTLTDLQKNNTKVILVYPIPEVGWNVSRKLITRLAISKNGLEDVFLNNPLTTSYKAFLNRTSHVYQIFDSINYERITRIYPEKLFCNNLIQNRCITHDKKKVFYIDDDHLSYDGAKMIVNKISESILLNN